MNPLNNLLDTLRGLDVMRLLIGINSTVFGLALLAAFGMFLIAANLGLISTLRLRLPSFGNRVDLEQAMADLEGEGDMPEMTLLDNLPLLDRVLGPLIRSLAEALPHHEDDWIANALDLLDYPSYLKSVSDYFAGRVMLSMTGFGLGLSFALYDLISSNNLYSLFVYPLVAALLGFLYPKVMVVDKLKSRREQILFEAPYVFDRLSVSIIANKNSVLEAIKDLTSDEEETRRKRQQEIEFFLRTRVTEVTSVPEGGYLMREMRLVAERCTREQMNLVDSFEVMAMRNTDVPLVEQFCHRIAILEPSGLNVNDALRNFGDRATEIVEDTIEARSAENSALMITPTLLSLVGIALVVAGPSLSIMGAMF